jgi:hypothetical protein
MTKILALSPPSTNRCATRPRHALPDSLDKSLRPTTIKSPAFFGFCATSIRAREIASSRGECDETCSMITLEDSSTGRDLWIMAKKVSSLSSTFATAFDLPSLDVDDPRLVVSTGEPWISVSLDSCKLLQHKPQRHAAIRTTKVWHVDMVRLVHDR